MPILQNPNKIGPSNVWLVCLFARAAGYFGKAGCGRETGIGEFTGPNLCHSTPIAGAVLMLFDIDAAKRLAEQKALAADYADAFLETVRNSLLMLDGGLRVKRATEVFYRTFRATPAETEGRLLYELGNGQWDIPELRELLEKILPEKTRVRDFEVRHEFPGIGPRRMLLNARRLERDIEGEPLILLSIEETLP